MFNGDPVDDGDYLIDWDWTFRGPLGCTCSNPDARRCSQLFLSYFNPAHVPAHRLQDACRCPCPQVAPG